MTNPPTPPMAPPPPRPMPQLDIDAGPLGWKLWSTKKKAIVFGLGGLFGLSAITAPFTDDSENAPPQELAATEDVGVTAPDLSCEDLQDARGQLDDIGIESTKQDKSDEDRIPFWEPNWLVVDQQPAPGEQVTGSMELIVLKDDEATVCQPETTTTTTTTQVPAPAEVAVETTAQTTTTAEANTTTTELVLTRDYVQSFAFAITFESNRSEVIGILNDFFVVQSVDRYVYNPETGLVSIDVTPAYDFDEGVRDDAWLITKAISVFWDEFWYEPRTGFSPDLEVRITTAQYRCNGDQMREIYDSRFGRPEWEANCRVR